MSACVISNKDMGVVMPCRVLLVLYGGGLNVQSRPLDISTLTDPSAWSEKSEMLNLPPLLLQNSSLI